MKKIAFLEAPVCTGSPTDGSQYAFAALKPQMKGILSDRARFLPMRPSDRVGMRSPANLRSLEEVMDVSRRLYRTVMRILEEGDFPVSIGGDHSIAMGSIAAAAETVGAQALSVIWIDGHTDIHTEKTTESGCIHGMPLAQAMGICGDVLNIGQEKVHLIGENCYIVGARSIDAGEYPIIAAQGVHLFSAEQVRARGMEAVMSDILSQIHTPFLHVSFDVDCMDGDVFPATGYRMPEGLTKHEAFTAVEMALASGKVLSMDLVEYNPLLDPDRTSMAILQEWIAVVDRHLSDTREYRRNWI